VQTVQWRDASCVAMLRSADYECSVRIPNKMLLKSHRTKCHTKMPPIKHDAARRNTVWQMQDLDNCRAFPNIPA